LGFDRPAPLDDAAVADEILAHLSIIPDPDIVFAEWSRVPVSW
jgi:hypothetical protein